MASPLAQDPLCPQQEAIKQTPTQVDPGHSSASMRAGRLRQVEDPQATPGGNCKLGRVPQPVQRPIGVFTFLSCGAVVSPVFPRPGTEADVVRHCVVRGDAQVRLRAPSSRQLGRELAAGRKAPGRAPA
ncbi:hypothetical protein NDU88_000307 [Pleurodeles waltl]|uniref:Uncharacterized protein n=1 Tax=Pleurodeles waltl TaxID=8319 RepID=A0AAV7VVN8_PLEWA|nr:hypothetical protein NDU88_000307 [Pleurodeles waltl]